MTARTTANGHSIVADWKLVLAQGSTACSVETRWIAERQASTDGRLLAVCSARLDVDAVQSYRELEQVANCECGSGLPGSSCCVASGFGSDPGQCPSNEYDSFALAYDSNRPLGRSMCGELLHPHSTGSRCCDGFETADVLAVEPVLDQSSSTVHPAISLGYDRSTD